MRGTEWRGTSGFSTSHNSHEGAKRIRVLSYYIEG